MGVKVRQKDGKWYVFINHNGQRKAKCVGDKRAAEEVRRKLEAKLTLGEFKLEDRGAITHFLGIHRAVATDLCPRPLSGHHSQQLSAPPTALCPPDHWREAARCRDERRHQGHHWGDDHERPQ